MATTRRQEALSALWSNVDLECGQWWLPQTKSGRGRYVVLNEQAKQLLTAQPSFGTSTWVFPGRDGDKPLHSPRKAFTRILEAAGVDHVRIHDLSHSFASLEVGNGASLYKVQSLLGHSSPQMTQRYAHLADNGLRRASQSVANAINAATTQSDQGGALTYQHWISRVIGASMSEGRRLQRDVFTAHRPLPGCRFICHHPPSERLYTPQLSRLRVADVRKPSRFYAPTEITTAPHAKRLIFVC